MIRVCDVIFEPLVGFLIHRRDAVDVLHVLIHLVLVEVYAVVLTRPFMPGDSVISLQHVVV
jgi:hypothetical protein